MWKNLGLAIIFSMIVQTAEISANKLTNISPGGLGIFPLGCKVIQEKPLPAPAVAHLLYSIFCFSGELFKIF